MSNLFDSLPKDALGDDPFIFDGDEVLNNGNSRSGSLPDVKSKPGFQAFTPKSRSFEQSARDFEEYGDPEQTGKGRQRRKKVSHKERAIEYLESLGWTVTWCEKFVIGESGFGFHQDFRGMWDARCFKDGHPELRVNVCGNKADRAAHIRKFCAEKTIKLFREDLTNPKVCCALLGFEMQTNGRYKAEPQRLTIRDLELCVGRRRKIA